MTKFRDWLETKENKLNEVKLDEASIKVTPVGGRNNPHHAIVEYGKLKIEIPDDYEFNPLVIIGKNEIEIEWDDFGDFINEISKIIKSM